MYTNYFIVLELLLENVKKLYALLRAQALNINRNSIFQHFSNVKQLVLLNSFNGFYST